MDVKDLHERKEFLRSFSDMLIRVALLAMLVTLCFRVIGPFLDLMVAALVLAVALYPLHQMLARRMGNRQGRSATLMVLLGLVLIGGPSVMLGISFADDAQRLHVALTEGTIHIKPPPESVADWPLIGERVDRAWTAVSEDLPGVLEQNRTKLTEFARKALGAAVGTASSVLLFLGALIIAGIMMAYGEGGGGAMGRIASRLVSRERGPYLVKLSVNTVRSVAMGVLGVAVIQALLIGLGLFAAGVPGAGILTIVVVFIGILQLPAVIITIPVIIYLWSGDGSTVMNSVFTVYLVVAGFSDGVLKPILLGRGVDAPMPVVLIGALGGMVVTGILGLFTGAVVLTVGYVLFMEWVRLGLEAEADEIAEAEPDEPSAGSDPAAAPARDG